MNTSGERSAKTTGGRRRQRVAAGPSVIGALVTAGLVVAAGVACVACGTTLPLESYETATDLPTHPTVAFFDVPPERVWDAVVRVIEERDEGVELLDRERGRATTGWKEAASLIHFRRRLGDSGEDARVPLPARYRILVRVSRVDEHTRVAVTADEETNFLILTGTDPQTGRAYYRDQWETTSTRTQREHRWLQDLRRELAGGRRAADTGRW